MPPLPAHSQALSRLIPTALPELPTATPRKDVVREGEPAREAGEFERQLESKVNRTANVMVEGLAALSRLYCEDPSVVVQKWESDAALHEILPIVAALPTEAATGTFKISGIVPTSVNRESARRFVALIVLYSARAMFFAERRGLDSIMSAADARLSKYEPHLNDDEKALIEGFPILYSLLDDPVVETAIHQFSRRIWMAFAETQRPLLCIATAHSLLRAWGRGEHSRIAEDDAALAEALRKIRGVADAPTRAPARRPWWKRW
jgi:hypothetical protein